MYVSVCEDKSKNPTKFRHGVGLDKKKLFVKNLPVGISEDDLRNIFQKHGDLKEVRLVTNRQGKPKGFAFVEFTDETSASRALVNTDGLQLQGKRISVAISNPPAREKQEKQESSAGKKFPGRLPHSSKIALEPRALTAAVKGLFINHELREMENGYDKFEEDALLSPYTYICQVPGKQIRGKLAKAFNYWLNIPDDKLMQIAEIVQMLHNGSLMIDDIEDNSILRRGLPVAHSIYGVPRTINTANYVYFLALEKTLELGHPQATTVYTEQLLELHRGQGMEIYWRDTVSCPTEEQYLNMVARKTGAMFGLAVGLMQLFSPCKEDYRPLIRNLGLYFQIRDDYANLCSKEYAEKKSYAEDLTEGKFSFPIVHRINSNRDDDQVLNIIRQRPKEYEVKKYCVDLLERNGAFTYTRQKLLDLEKEAYILIENYGGNPHLKNILEELRKIYS